jgi:HAMP domain-containing protein
MTQVGGGAPGARLWWWPADPRRWSLGTKIAVTLVLAVLVPLAVLARSSLNVGRDAVVIAQLDSVEGAARVASSAVSEYLQGALGRADQLATRADVVDFLGADAPPPNLEGELVSSDIRSVGLFDRAGRLRTVRTRLDEADFGADRTNWLQPAAAGQLSVGRIRFDPESFDSAITVAAPARIPGGAPVGLVALDIAGADVLYALHSAPLSAGGQVLLIDADGVVVAARDTRLLGEVASDLGLSALDAGALERRSGSETDIAWRGRDKQVVGWSRVDDGLVAIVLQPRSVFLGPIDRLASSVWLLFVVVGIIAFLGALLLARRLSRPISVLTAAASSMEAGHEVRFEALERIGKSHDDVGRLARVFGRMAAQVAERERGLRAQVSALRVEIDQQRRQQAVEEVTDTEFFRDLQSRAEEMRRRAKQSSQEEDS